MYAIRSYYGLQKLDFIDPQGIGMWGHSMAGNLVLRAMLIESDIQAGVIWAGAVYSYDDFVRYGIDDNTYRPPTPSTTEDGSNPRRRSQEIFDAYGRPDSQVEYWKAVSLTENIEFLNQPLQLRITSYNVCYTKLLRLGGSHQGYQARNWLAVERRR